MKRIGIILFVMMMTLVSCSKDDDSSDNSLIGTWEYSLTEMDTVITQLVTFIADNTGTMVSTVVYQGETITDTSTFTWSTNGNKVTIVADGETTIATYSIAGNKLTVTFEGETLVFTRK